MKKKRVVKSRKMWIIFTFLTFSVMSVSILVTTLCLFMAYDKGILSPKFGVSAFLPFSLTSIAVATVLSMFVSRAVLYPVKDVSDAAERIIKGDFSQRVDEYSIIEEVALVGKNFNLMMTELEKLEGFRSDFGANVSHEFKTPLGKIKGYAELLKSGEPTEAERRDYLEKIIVNVDNLNNMSEKMLSLARFENQQMVLKKSEFKLDEQIRQSFLAFENNWIIKDIEPILELEEITYCGDENILSHIWSNLFENAIKFTPEGGKIEIGLKKEKKYVEFRVFNTGDGINENDIVHIFEKFYQADKSRKRRGSGLGLPLVKRLVELNGGEIFVKSILGVGTEFKVLLPLKLDE